MSNDQPQTGIRSALVERFGEEGIAALENSGLLNRRPQHGRSGLMRIDGAEVVYDRRGVAYLVADRMSAEPCRCRAAASILGEHHGPEDSPAPGLDAAEGPRGGDGPARRFHAPGAWRAKATFILSSSGHPMPNSPERPVHP